MAKNKALLASIERIGLGPDGTTVDMEVEDAPTPSEAAASRVANLQSHYDALAVSLDPESNIPKELKKELESAKKQTGVTAKSKTMKDLTAAKFQINLHVDALEKEQQKALETRQATLEQLKKAVSDYEEVMHKQSALEKEVMDYAVSLQTQTTAMIKLAAAEEEGAAAQQTAQVQEQAQTVTLPPQLAMLADTLKTVLNQVTSTQIAESAEDQADAIVAQLKTQISTSLQPLLGAGNQYGPAALGGQGARTAPYQEPPKDSKIAAASALTASATADASQLG